MRRKKFLSLFLAAVMALPASGSWGKAYFRLDTNPVGTPSSGSTGGGGTTPTDPSNPPPPAVALAPQFNGPSNARVNRSYAASSTSGGGTAPYAWSLASDSAALPDGLAINPSTGAVSGMPRAVSFARGIKLKVVDSSTPNRAGTTVPFAINVTAVDGPVLQVASSYPATKNTAFSVSVAPTGGTPAYTVSQSGGVMPDGLAVGGNGVIAGTPTVAGTFPGITLAATDSDGNSTVSDPFSIVVTDADVAKLAVFLDDVSGVVGTDLTATPTATNGQPPYAWSYSGPLPSGLTVDPSTGTVSGKPTVAVDAATVVLTAKDASSPQKTASKSVTFSIAKAPTQAVSAIDQSFRVGSPYDAPFPLQGAQGSTYAIFLSGTQTAWTPPSGLTASGGRFIGTPTTTAPPALVYGQATGPDGTVTKTGDFQVAVYGPLTVGTQPVHVSHGQSVSQPLTTVTGAPAPTGPVTYEIVGATQLPDGLSLDPNGTLSGTVGQNANDATVTVKATDSETPAAVVTGQVDVRVETSAALIYPVAIDQLQMGDAVANDNQGTVGSAIDWRRSYDKSNATQNLALYCASNLYCSLQMRFAAPVVGDSVDTDATGVSFQYLDPDANVWRAVTEPVSATYWRLVATSPGTSVIAGTFRVGLGGQFPASLDVTVPSATTNLATGMYNLGYYDAVNDRSDFESSGVPISYFYDDTSGSGSTSTDCSGSITYCTVVLDFGQEVAANTFDVQASVPYAIEVIPVGASTWYDATVRGGSGRYWRVRATAPSTPLSVGTFRIGLDGLPPIQPGNFPTAANTYPVGDANIRGTNQTNRDDHYNVRSAPIANLYDKTPYSTVQTACNDGDFCQIELDFPYPVLADSVDLGAVPPNAKLQGWRSGSFYDVTPGNPMVSPYWRLMGINRSDRFTADTFRVGYQGVFPPYLPDQISDASNTYPQSFYYNSTREYRVAPVVSDMYDNELATNAPVTCYVDPNQPCALVMNFGQSGGKDVYVAADSFDTELPNAIVQYQSGDNWLNMTPGTPVVAHVFRLTTGDTVTPFLVSTFRVGLKQKFPPYLNSSYATADVTLPVSDFVGSSLGYRKAPPVADLYDGLKETGTSVVCRPDDGGGTTCFLQTNYAAPTTVDSVDTDATNGAKVQYYVSDEWLDLIPGVGATATSWRLYNGNTPFDVSAFRLGYQGRFPSANSGYQNAGDVMPNSAYLGSNVGGRPAPTIADLYDTDKATGAPVACRGVLNEYEGCYLVYDFGSPTMANGTDLDAEGARFQYQLGDDWIDLPASGATSRYFRLLSGDGTGPFYASTARLGYNGKFPRATTNYASADTVRPTGDYFYANPQQHPTPTIDDLYDNDLATSTPVWCDQSGAEADYGCVLQYNFDQPTRVDSIDTDATSNAKLQYQYGNDWIDLVPGVGMYSRYWRMTTALGNRPIDGAGRVNFSLTRLRLGYKGNFPPYAAEVRPAASTVLPSNALFGTAQDYQPDVQDFYNTDPIGASVTCGNTDPNACNLEFDFSDRTRADTFDVDATNGAKVQYRLGQDWLDATAAVGGTSDGWRLSAPGPFEVNSFRLGYKGVFPPNYGSEAPPDGGDTQTVSEPPAQPDPPGTPLTITAPPSGVATVGQRFAAFARIAGATAYTVSVVQGPLPDGLVQSGGAIQGVATTDATPASNIVLTVTDANDPTRTASSAPFAIGIQQPDPNAPPPSDNGSGTPAQTGGPLSVSARKAILGVMRAPLGATIAVQGGSGGYTMTLESGSIPGGLSISGLRIVGTPTQFVGQNMGPLGKVPPMLATFRITDNANAAHTLVTPQVAFYISGNTNLCRRRPRVCRNYLNQ